jgi:RecA-family ATPase
MTLKEINADDRTVILIDRKRSGFVLYRDLENASKKEWLVQDMLGVCEQSAIYGVPGSGKSALTEDLGLHVAAGVRWHGRAVKQGAVVYVALERHKLVERRAIAFRQRHGCADLPFAIVSGFYDFRDSKPVLRIAEIVRQVEEATGQPVILIIIDTISRALCGGDENSSKDMGAIVAATSRLQAETKAHILWVHHMPQDGAERLRGHGALLGAMDTTVLVTKTGSQRTANVVKSNDAEEGERDAFTLESVTIGPDTTAPVVVPADPTMRAQSDGPKLTKNQQTMFSLLQSAGASGLTTDRWNELARNEGLGVSRKADLYDIRSALKSKGLVRQYGDRWNVC